MRKALEPTVAIDLTGDEGVGFAGPREIIIPHDAEAGPVTAVRNVVIQASLVELKNNGYYDRYTTLIAPDILERLRLAIAPSWIEVDLALAHYAACDNLRLTPEEFEAMGKRVGHRVQETVLVSLAKKVREAGFDLCPAVGALHRMWPRLFQGGSVQVVKVGSKEKLLELRGFALNRYHYYRQAHLAALRATYAALGTRVAQTKVVSYDAAGDELVVGVAWF